MLVIIHWDTRMQLKHSGKVKKFRHYEAECFIENNEYKI